MSTSFDRFLAGHDGLAALLRALPLHAPPASMDAWFAHAAQEAEAERAAATATQDTLQFEAPATMASLFAAAAAQAEQTQAAQRAAVQARLAQGDTADHTLGAPLSEAAREWIAQQMRNAADAVPVMPAAPAVTGTSNPESVAGSVPAAASAGTSNPVPLSSLADAGRSSAQGAGSIPDSSDAPAFHAAAASTSTQGSTPASAASSTQAPTRAPSGIGPAPVRRSARRLRWMPPLALAASVTLAVGLGLQWQASRPVPDALTPAAAIPAAAESGRVPARPAAADGADRASEGSVQDVAQRPAFASADKPTSAQQVERQPAPSLQELAPAAMPAPVSAPLPARVVTPPASARPTGMTSTQPPMVPEPTQDDAHAAMAPPPPPAPITANNDDVKASGAPAAGTDNSAPAPRPTERAPAPAAPAAAAKLPMLPALPAPSQDPSLRIERMAANAPATTELVISRNTSRAAPTAAPAPRPEPQAGKPQPGASRDSWSSTSATRIATQQAQQQRETDTREQTHRTVSLKLSTSPSDWLEDRAASGNTQTPITIRIMAATPSASAVQTWAAQLRKQFKQRGRPTQIELAQDSTLAADELRLELSSAAP